MGHTNMDSSSSVTGAIITGGIWVVGKIMPVMSDLANILAVLVGLTTLYINWPKIIARTKQILNRFKK